MNSVSGRQNIKYNVDLSAKSAICLHVSRSAAHPTVILHEKDADRPITPASITKLLTAVTALRIASDKGVSPTAELTVIASDIVKGSGLNLREGDRLSFRDALANLLLPSSNVAANVIARTFGGILLQKDTEQSIDPIKRFLREMNAVARDLQMTASRFLNPHGLAIKGQRSTARDLSRLVMQCLDHLSPVSAHGTDLRL